jgi:hypothetical protein
MNVLAGTTAPAALLAGGMDADLLRQMRDEGLLSPEDLQKLEGGTVDVIPGEIPLAAEDEDAAAALLEEQEQRAAIYAEQNSVADLVEPENVVQEATAVVMPTAPKTRKAAGTPKTPRVARVKAAGTHGAVVASTIAGPTVELLAGGGDIDVQALVDGINAVKVREKVVNWFDHFHKGKALSVFSQIALNTLRAEGQITAKRLVEIYRATAQRNNTAKTYDEGTARSQAQQLFTVLRTLCVITPTGIANPDSVYWRKFTA